MSISADTITLQPIAAAPISAAPLRQAPVAPIGDRENASNDRRQNAKDGRARAGISFRSFLDAATFAGLSKAVSSDTSKADTTPDTASASRSTKAYAKTTSRDEPIVIDAAEGERLYRSAQTARTRTDNSAQQDAGNINAREYQVASTRYAKSFFAVAGTFAKRGESLELSA